jgi:hypothetical protein
MQQLLCEASQFEVMTNYNGQQGYFVKIFLIDDSVTLNDWRVTWDAIKQDAPKFLDYPGITFYRPDGVRDHPEIQQTDDYLADRENLLRIQDAFKSAKPVDVQLNAAKHSATLVAQITDPRTQSDIESKLIKYVSPSLYPMSQDHLRIVNEGEPNQYREATRFLPNHFAFVDNPAFGKDKARITGTCTGTAGRCSHQLVMNAGNNSINQQNDCTLCQMEQKDFETKISEMKASMEKLDASLKAKIAEFETVNKELVELKASKTKSDQEKLSVEEKLKSMQASNDTLTVLAKKPIVEQILEANRKIGAIKEEDLPKKKEELMKASIETLSSQLEIISPFAAAYRKTEDSESVPFGMGSFAASNGDQSAEELLEEVMSN